MVKAASAIFALLVVLAGALVWVELNREIRSIRVDGELTVAEQQQIRRAVGRSLGPGLLGIDLVPWAWMRFHSCHTGLSRLHTMPAAGGAVWVLEHFNRVTHLGSAGELTY